MSDVFDQETAEVGDAVHGEIVLPREPRELVLSDGERVSLPVALGDYRPQSESEARFLALLNDVPWTVQGDAAVQMALATALGDPDKAGEQPEARSVRNLKLKNKVHAIIGFALSISSKFADSSGRACPVFAQVEARFTDGEIFAYSIGGWGPVGQLLAWHRGDKFPHTVQIVEVPSDKGNPAYRYVDA